MRVNISELELRENKLRLLDVTIDGNIRKFNEIKKNEALIYHEQYLN